MQWQKRQKNTRTHSYIPSMVQQETRNGCRCRADNTTTYDNYNCIRFQLSLASLLLLLVISCFPRRHAHSFRPCTVSTSHCSAGYATTNACADVHVMCVCAKIHILSLLVCVETFFSFSGKWNYLKKHSVSFVLLLLSLLLLYSLLFVHGAN